MPELTTEEIMGYLPHRYPMLMVDRILECDDEHRIVGIKNVSINEEFMQGHFPGNPVMPGVLQIEAMAQTGGILLMRIGGKDREVAPYFMAIDKAKFRRIVKPGDQMRIEVEVMSMRSRAMKLKGRVTVDGAVASQAEFMVMIIENNA